jgi:hypothetical protein
MKTRRNKSKAMGKYDLHASAPSSSTQLAKLLLCPKTPAAPPLALKMTPPPSRQPAAMKPHLLQQRHKQQSNVWTGVKSRVVGDARYTAAAVVAAWVAQGDDGVTACWTT